MVSSACSCMTAVLQIEARFWGLSQPHYDN